jgi:hypothetical protein
MDHPIAPSGNRLALLLGSVVWFAASVAYAQGAAPAAVRAKSADRLIYGEAVIFHNLSLVPVGTTAQGPFQPYTLLEEGTSAKTLDIRELAGNSDQAQVNAVQVRNRGKQPVYLLGGEMILGGKQDRIIQQDTVIENDGKWVNVPVFCVEQGRWSGRNMRFRSGGAIAHAKLRQAALSGSQSEVWAEVARKNVKHGTQSSTQTYRRTIQSAKVREKIANYISKLGSMLPNKMQLSGMIFAVNGKIRVADLFGNPALFDKLQDKLLAAYVLEALEEQVDRRAKPVSKAKAKSWLGKARKAARGKGKKSGRALNYTMENDEYQGNETVDAKTKQKVRETYIYKK